MANVKKPEISASLGKSAVEKAIKFLDAVGAKYTIKFNEEEFTNKPTRGSYTAFYVPIFEAAFHNKETSCIMKVPPDIDINALRGTAVSYLIKRFGNGNVISEIKQEQREVHLIWIEGAEPEVTQ